MELKTVDHKASCQSRSKKGRKYFMVKKGRNQFKNEGSISSSASLCEYGCQNMKRDYVLTG